MLRRIGRIARDAVKVNQRQCLQNQSHVSLRFYSQAHRDNSLRILFCGSDEFSITSLRALHDYSQEKDSNVASISVAAKTDKRVGRGLKLIRPPPIKPVAQSLGLSVHQFDTFRGWNLPQSKEGESYINMVIAVSFGLLVPPRILGACEFGGLNVHPSMLPDLKGSAPVEHAIINGYQKTGVTVQTLHPSKFDEGKIVMQTPSPGLDIPDPDGITSSELREILAPIGAEMLVECLRNKRYLQPIESTQQEKMLNFAPKLSPGSRHIDFQSMNLTHILRLNRAIGRLWANAKTGEEQADVRLVYGQDINEADVGQLDVIPKDFLKQVPPGLPFNVTERRERLEESKQSLLIKTSDSRVLCIPSMTVSGAKPGPALASAARAGLIKKSETINDHDLHVFRTVLG